MHIHKSIKSGAGKLTILLLSLITLFSLTTPAIVFAGKLCGAGVVPTKLLPNPDPTPVVTAIDLGCTNTGNPIADATYAVIRFLSAGVGLVIIGSIVLAGIQYSTSRGDPQSTAKALGRIRSTLFALLIFIFGYAFLNYIIPGGFFHP